MLKLILPPPTLVGGAAGRYAVWPAADHFDQPSNFTGSSHGSLSVQPQPQGQRSSEKHQEESADMNRVRTAVTAAAIAGSMLVGGVVGATLYGVSALTAAAAPTASSPTPAAGSPSGTFVPHATAAHQATENAAPQAPGNRGAGPDGTQNMRSKSGRADAISACPP